MCCPCPRGAPSLQGDVLGGSITQTWSGWRGEHQGCSPSPDTASPRQEFSGSSPKRRRAEDKDEGIGSPDIWEDEKAEDLRREMIELRQQLDKERSVRMMLEEQVRPCGAGSGCGTAACAALHWLCTGRARPLAGCAAAVPEPPAGTGAAAV